MSTARPSRTPSSADAADRVQRSKKRIRERRVAAREREQAISAAVGRYLSRWQAITACETQREQDVAALHRQIREVEDRAAAVIADHRAEQDRIAADIRARTSTDDEVAELLEITPRQLRQHLAAARTDDTVPETPPSTAAPEGGHPDMSGPSSSGQARTQSRARHADTFDGQTRQDDEGCTARGDEDVDHTVARSDDGATVFDRIGGYEALKPLSPTSMSGCSPMSSSPDSSPAST